MLTEEKFLSLMKEIDQSFSKEELDFHLRPLKAFNLLLEKTYPNLPAILRFNQNIPPDDYSPNSLYTQVKRWYDETYGNRIKVHLGLGKYVLIVKNEPWEVEYPRYFGENKLYISSEIIKGSNNILCKVKNMTLKIASELTELEKESILKEYIFGYNALDLLCGTEKLPFMKQAKNDYDMAIENIFNKSPNYNNAKWSSLQFAEKSIKSKLELAGESFPKNHDLAGLLNLLEKLQIYVPIQFIYNLQCSAQVRYERNTVTRNEAVLAIQDSLKLFVQIYDRDRENKVIN